MKILVKPVLIKDITPAWLKEFSHLRNEPLWVGSLREAALIQYKSLPWPDPKDETWKRTHWSGIPWDKIEFSPIPGEIHNELPATFSGLGVLSDNLEDGRIPARFLWDFNRGYSVQLPHIVQKKGIEWIPFHMALRQKEEMMRTAWATAIEKASQNKFQSLLLALASGGSCLTVAKGAQIRTPLHQYFKGNKSLAAYFVLNFVFAEEQSQFQIWEEMVPEPSSENKSPGSLLMSQTLIEAKEHSHVNFYALQKGDLNRVHFQFQDIRQDAQSRFNSVTVAIGSRIFHNEAVLNMEGEKAENKILGVLFGSERQNFENIIHQRHLNRRTTSDIQFRGAQRGESRSFFSGLIYIAPKAQLSDAYQSCKTLLLSPDAKADAIPNLEILADDVKCSHGAAAGAVDEEQKYYLQTRGIPAQDAEKIIVEGFVEPVVAAVPDEGIQARLRRYIEDKMKN